MTIRGGIGPALECTLLDSLEESGGVARSPPVAVDGICGSANAARVDIGTVCTIDWDAIEKAAMR